MKVAKPLSRKGIRDMANRLRCICDKQNDLFFDIVRFVELILPKLDTNFTFMVCPESEMGSDEGLTYPNEGVIKIREDVYDRATNGVGRDRFTIAHELAHYLLHEDSSISFSRNNTRNIPTYKDPEWQADAFAGELLMPADLISGLTVQEISRECEVSYSAALCQLRKI